MPLLSFLLLFAHSAVPQFVFDIFHQMKTSRRNLPVPCPLAAGRLLHGNRLLRPEEKNGSFCRSEDLCRSHDS